MANETKQAAELYADAWSRMDFTHFFDALHDDCIYSSQYVDTDRIGKDNIVIYLSEKIRDVIEVGNKVVTKMATLKTTGFAFSRSGDPCVAVYQFGSDDISAVVFFEVCDGKIIRFSLCKPELCEVSVAKTERYSIVWQECRDQSDIAKRFHVPGFDGYLPFFISGKDVTALMNKEKVELREEQLLKGILYGLNEYDHHSKFWHSEKCRQTYIYLLDLLGKGFDFDNPETMILDIANSIRKINGNYPSSIVLKVGHGLMPKSSKIMSDYICDLWNVASEGNGSDELYDTILGLMDKIDLDDIQPVAKEIVCYYGICAMCLSSKHYDSEQYLKKFVYPHVAIPELKQRIVALFDNPDAFRPADLRLFDVNEQ